MAQRHVQRLEVGSQAALGVQIAQELELHAKQELTHALTIAKQIDYLGGMPTVNPKPVRTSEKAEEMLQFDLDNENETIAQYRQRVRQCEALGEYALAEHIHGRSTLDAVRQVVREEVAPYGTVRRSNSTVRRTRSARR